MKFWGCVGYRVMWWGCGGMRLGGREGGGRDLGEAPRAGCFAAAAPLSPPTPPA